MTYELLPVAGGTAIRCLLCGSVSHAAGDVENKYCGRCHLFHDVVDGARVMHHDGATHDCGEWRTARGVCAVCEKPVAAEVVP